MPDGELHRCERQISDAIAAMLARFPPGTWCAATWRGDGHPDHEATGRAAATAAADSGTVFVEYPVWMWHWARPGDPAVPWHRTRRVALTDRALRLKRLATHCFASQVGPRRTAPRCSRQSWLSGCWRWERWCSCESATG